MAIPPEGLLGEKLAAKDKELAEARQENVILLSVLMHIELKCADYDGYETVEGLKALVETIQSIVINKEVLP